MNGERRETLMVTFAVGLIVGLFVGASLGIMAAALCWAGHEN